jgi:hypothetical protein
MHENIQVYKISQTKIRTKASLIPNLNIKQKKKKTWQVQDNNSTRFYYNNEIRT